LNSRLTAESLVRKKRAASSGVGFSVVGVVWSYLWRAGLLELALRVFVAFVLATFLEDPEAFRVAVARVFDAVPPGLEAVRARLFADADFAGDCFVATLLFAALVVPRFALLFFFGLRGLAEPFRGPRLFALVLAAAFPPTPIFATTRFATPVSRAIGERPPPAVAEMPALERSISLLKRFPSSSETSAARLFRSNHSKNSSHPISSRESSPLKPGKSILRIPGSSSDPVAFTRAG
jgi:hypothetical protein